MVAPAPRICVIILNYNGKAYLDSCLESVFADADESVRVLLVDNGSSDGSVEDAEAAFPSLEVIRNGENLYFCAGNNVGIRRAMGAGDDYVFILNNDTTLEPGCLAQLTKFMENTPTAGGCQPLLVFMDSPKTIQSAGCRVSLSGKAWDDKCGEPIENAGSRPFESLGITGGAMFLRAAALEKTGLFCESFQMYFEDVDLSLRLRADGHSLHTVPAALVRHKASATTDQLGIARRVYFCERNAHLVAARNFPIWRALFACVLALSISIAVVVKASLVGNFFLAWTTLMANFVGVLWSATAILQRPAGTAPKLPTQSYFGMLDNKVLPPTCRQP